MAVAHTGGKDTTSPPPCVSPSAYFASTFLTFLSGRVLPLDFLKILPRLVRASPLPIVCSS